MLTSKERLDNASGMFQKNVLNPFEADKNFDVEVMKELVDKFMAKQIEGGMAEAEVDRLKTLLIVSIAQQKKEIDRFKVLRGFGKTVISYADIVTDVLVLSTFVKMNSSMAAIQGLSLGFSMFVQSISSIIFGQPIWVALLGLVGMKPIVEAYRDAIDAKPFPKQRMANETMLMVR